MKKTIMTLFVLSIVLFSAVKGGLWYFTQKFADDLIISAKPMADITYTDIKTSVTGSVSLTGLKVFFPIFEDTIRIESIQLTAPNAIALLMLDNTLQQNEIPDSLGLFVSGISLDLNGKIAKMLDKPDSEPTSLEIFSTLACGDVHRIASNALSNMGYDTLTSDTMINYQLNSRDNTLDFELRNDIRDMTRLNFSGAIQGVTDLSSLKSQSRIGKVKLEILDDSYIERKNKFCANQRKSKVNEYINEHTLQVGQYLQSYGISIEEGLLNAYKDVLESSAAITFEANLSQLTGMEEIMSFEPNDIIQFIHLKLFVNDKRINEISIHVDKEKLIETATSDDITLETPDEIKKKNAIITRKYRPSSVAELKNFNGYRVKIETKKGKNYRGTIKTNNPAIYEIETRLRAGSISYHIPVNHIKKAEVFN